MWACGDERATVAELVAPARSSFSAMAWGSKRRLVAAIGAEVWVVDCDATGAPGGPTIQKQLFAEGNAFRTLQCVGELLGHPLAVLGK